MNHRERPVPVLLYLISYGLSCDVQFHGTSERDNAAPKLVNAFIADGNGEWASTLTELDGASLLSTDLHVVVIINERLHDEELPKVEAYNKKHKVEFNVERGTPI